LTKVVAYHEGCVALQITHKNATKHHAALKIAEFLNIKSNEMIGVGDGYNDFDLFKACGLRIAVGNAVDELKLMADYVAPDVKEDAIAHIIEKFVLNRYQQTPQPLKQTMRQRIRKYLESFNYSRQDRHPGNHEVADRIPFGDSIASLQNDMRGYWRNRTVSFKLPNGVKFKASFQKPLQLLSRLRN